MKFLLLLLAPLAAASHEGRAASPSDSRFIRPPAAAAAPRQAKTARRRASRRRAARPSPPCSGARAVNSAQDAGRVEGSETNRAADEGASMIQNGIWGGKGITVEVTDGNATVEYDCAHGTIEGLKPGSDGAFEARGTHTVESMGPERSGAEPAARPARYAGRVSGDTMTLTVTLTDASAEVGTFSLVFGRGGWVVKCK